MNVRMVHKVLRSDEYSVLVQCTDGTVWEMRKGHVEDETEDGFAVHSQEWSAGTWTQCPPIPGQEPPIPPLSPSWDSL